jgi:hypothetical protein
MAAATPSQPDTHPPPTGGVPTSAGERLEKLIAGPWSCVPEVAESAADRPDEHCHGRRLLRGLRLGARRW